MTNAICGLVFGGFLLVLCLLIGGLAEGGAAGVSAVLVAIISTIGIVYLLYQTLVGERDTQ